MLIAHRGSSTAGRESTGAAPALYPRAPLLPELLSAGEPAEHPAPAHSLWGSMALVSRCVMGKEEVLPPPCATAEGETIPMQERQWEGGSPDPHGLCFGGLKLDDHCAPFQPRPFYDLFRPFGCRAGTPAPLCSAWGCSSAWSRAGEGKAATGTQ